MAIFGKKKDKGQQEAGNNAGSPTNADGGGGSTGGSMNGISRSPPIGSGSREDHGGSVLQQQQQQQGFISHAQRSSLGGTGSGGAAGVGSGFAPNFIQANSTVFRAPPPNGMQGQSPIQQDNGHPGSAGGFRFGGPAPRPDASGQSGIPLPGSQMRGPNSATPKKMSMESEGGQGPQQSMYGPVVGGGMGPGGMSQHGSGIPTSGSGVSGLPSSSSQGLPLQSGSGPERPRAQQVVYPWSQRSLLMNPPRFLDETRQPPPGAASPSPFPRYGHAANAFASPMGEVYLFGGLVRESVKNDLYVVYVDKVLQPPALTPLGSTTMVSTGNVNATLVQTTGEIPPPRVGHATILVANVLILWGGDTKVRADDKQDEGLYLLNLSTREWTRVRQSTDNPNEGPVGRYGHTVSIVGSRFYVFGGQVDGTFMNDLWTFDLNSLKTTPTWDVITPASEMPPRRTGHASITYKDKIYIFGGTDGQYHYNDTWTYDVATNSWKELSCIGYIPVPREGHAACLVDDVMYIFGGRGVDGKDLGDLASFRISNQRWYMFANMGPSPSGRSGHALTTYQNKVVVLGGESFTGAKADDPTLVHVLDTGKIKYPPEGGSKLSTSAGAAGTAGRKSSLPPNGNEGIGPRAVSPTTDRAVSPSQRGIPASNNNDSLMGVMQRPPGSIDQQSQLQKQPSSQLDQTSKIPPVAAGAAGAGVAGVAGIAAAEVASNRAVSPSAAQRGVNNPAASTIPPSNQIPLSRSVAPSSVPAYTGPKSQRSLENLRNGATSPPGTQHRGINGFIGGGAAAAAGVGAAGALAYADRDRGNTVTSPTAQDGFHYGSNSIQQNGNMRGGPGYASALSPIEVDQMKRREIWMKAALAMAVKKGFVMPDQEGILDSSSGSHSTRKAASDLSLEDFDTGAEGSEKEKVLRAIISLKAQLASAKSTIAQQAQGEADRVAEADRGRSAALSEAAFHRAKAEALESGNMNEVDRLQRGRNADIERQLSMTLRECSELERQLSRTNEELKTEQRLRISAEERLNETSQRAMTAETSHTQLQDELSQLQKKSYLHESQLRDHKEKVATLTSLAATHQSNHQEAQRQLEDYQTSSEKHYSALKDMQAALAASTARGAEHEHLHYQNRDLVQQHETTIAGLRSELTTKSAEVDRHVSRSTELESLVTKHREEAESHKLAVSNGLSQVLAYHQQRQASRRKSLDGSNGIPLHAQEQMRAMQEESESLRQLHSQSKQTADYANSLLSETRDRNVSLQKQQSGLKSELSAMRSQLAIALQEVARLKEDSASKEYELRDAKRSVESTQVKHSLLKQVMSDRGIPISGEDEMNAKNSQTDKRIRELEEQMESQNRELQEKEQQLRETSSRVEELSRQVDPTTTRSNRGSMIGGAASNEKLLAVQKRAEDAEKELQDTNNVYRERMSQLENDYQTAVQFVKGSEKMLRRMKDELTKYKTENTSLQSELISVRSVGYTPSSDTEATRDIEALRTRLVDLTQENESVGAENRSLEKKMNALMSEQKDLRDRHRSLTDGPPTSEGSRRAKELEVQVNQLESSLNDVRKELQETLALNTHLSNELQSNSRRASANGSVLKSAPSSASLAKDLNTAQQQNEQLQAEKTSLSQRLQEAEDKLQLLLGRMEGNEAESNPARDSHAFSISSELDKWERDRATDTFGVVGPSSSQ